MNTTASTFHREPESVSRVRRFVSAAIAGVPVKASDAIVLMASELATNVVRHAGSDYDVEVRRDADSVEVHVTDRGGGRPTKRSPGPEEPTGRGILIVEALSHDWGTLVDAAQSETTVWFRVDLAATANQH